MRHGSIKKDPAVHASQWVLSDKGVGEAEQVSLLPCMSEVGVVFASSEKKAQLTAGPIAVKRGLTINVSSAFDEVARGEKFLTDEEFETEKTKQLTDLDYAAFNGETGNAARQRFADGVKEVSSRYQGQTILIVTHGTVLNIYFAGLLQAEKELPARWSKTAFCAYGIVEDGKVVKDIV